MSLPVRTWFLAAAVLLAAAVAAPSAFAAKGMEIGVQDDAQFLSSVPSARAAAFAQARRLGVTALRANVAWARVAPDAQSPVAPVAPVYDLSAYDRLVDEAAASGIHVQLTLAGPAPAWATADHAISADHPDPARFGEFAGAVAAHFAGRVRALSIWNEPNWYGLLEPETICGQVAQKAKPVKGKKGAKGKTKQGAAGGKAKGGNGHGGGGGSGGGKAKGSRAVRRKLCVKTSARVYRGLYQAGYAAIKAASPSTPVWMGETNPYVNRRKQSTAPLAWLRQLACVDGVVKGCTGTLKADGYAHHPYAFDRNPASARSGPDDVTIATLGRLRKQLAKLRPRIVIAHGAIYLTEFAYYSSGPNAKPEKKRAAWTRKAFEIALKAAAVRQLVYYQLIDPPATETWRTGLITAGGAQHAAFGALQKFAVKRRKALAQPHPFALPAAH